MVYFIEIEGTPYVKVGRAINAKKRLSSLSTAHPFPLILKHTISTSGSHGDVALEKQIHVHLKEYRIRGEWFELPWGELTRVVNHFETGQDYLLNPIFDGEFIGLRASVQRVSHGHLQTVTEPCFFCHKTHWHGAINSVITIDGHQTYGHRVKHCLHTDLKRKHPNGQMLINRGYYLWIENPEHEATQRRLLRPYATFIAKPEYE